MKRTVLVLLLLAVTLGAAAAGKDPSVIVANGHVEATDVLVSTKVAGDHRDGWPSTRGTRSRRARSWPASTRPTLAWRCDAARAERARPTPSSGSASRAPARRTCVRREAQVARVEADLAGAQKDLERMEGLLANGSGTTKARDDARTRRDVAAASLDGAPGAARPAEAGSRREEIDAARARLAAAEARIAQLDQQVKDAVDREPAGRRRHREAGRDRASSPPGAPGSSW